MYVIPPLKCMMANYVHLLLDSCKKMGIVCVWNCRREDCVLCDVRFANGVYSLYVCKQEFTFTVTFS